MHRQKSSKAVKSDLLSRSRMAQMKGVSRAAVTAACRDDGPLASAVRGSQVDVNDPAAIAWLAEAQRGPDGAAPADSQGPSKAQMLELSRRKRAAEAEKIELANAQTRGALISRELVSTHVFGALEFLHKRLLGDAAKMIANKVFHSTLAKGTLEEAQRSARDELSKQLRAAKAQIIRLLLQPDDKAKGRRSTPTPRKRKRKAPAK
ncbi:MAG TPA: hypothetical protein VHP33_09110 [Polyangiaceae bacterium]|nr:hypothetical protein [Polyangiaceae bacterium]